MQEVGGVMSSANKNLFCVRFFESMATGVSITRDFTDKKTSVLEISGWTVDLDEVWSSRRRLSLYWM